MIESALESSYYILFDSATQFSCWSHFVTKYCICFFPHYFFALFSGYIIAKNSFGQQLLTKISKHYRGTFELSKAVPHVLIRCLNVKLSQYQFNSCFNYFQQKMLLLEIAFFHDFGDFGQRLLTACWPPVKFEIGNLERVIWTPFLPNIMVRNLILASGGQKRLFFRLRYKVGITTFIYHLVSFPHKLMSFQAIHLIFSSGKI